MPSYGQGRAYRRTALTFALASVASVAALTAADDAGAASGSGDRAQLRTTEATPQTAFHDSRRKARFDFELAGPRRQEQTVIVKAIELKSGDVQRRWRFKNLAGKDPKRVKWDGRLGPRRKRDWTGQGKHVFKVFEPGGRKADMSKAEGRKRFRMYKHRFPLGGRHTYGDGIGAGRGHQGQDLFAKCGKPVRAARGGKVQHRAYHGSAGNYVVIDAKGTNLDYVYMHLKKRHLPREGARVRTGEKIGLNGATGNASGCHLHFELWRGGWYEGSRSKPISPTKRLKRWDSWS